MTTRIRARRGFTYRAPFRLFERWFLGRDATAPIIRFVVIWGSFALYWVLLVLVAGLPASSLPRWLAWLPFPFDILVTTGSMFFAPAVLANLVPVAAALWLGFRVGAHYLADLFELENPSTASRYLWPSLFGLDHPSYPKLEISTGDLDLIDHDHPLFAIGGPGYLKIHLGHAAVLEDLEGRPRAYGPSNLQFIQGFERLRDVIDLRDQAGRVDTVRAMTRDGIAVFARDAQMVFRVYRGPARERTLDNPYPFDEASVRRLAYGQPVSESGRSRWVESLPGRVEREIQAFVERLTIEEFLALRPQAASREPARAFDIPREELSARFHTPEAVQRFREAGLELDWVGVGTWEVRDRLPESEAGLGVSQTLITGWREKERVDLYTSPDYLERQQARGFREYASGLLMELVETWRAGTQAQDPQALCYQLLSRIQDRVRRLGNEVRGDRERRLPVGFDEGLRHLGALVTPRWLGGGT